MNYYILSNSTGKEIGKAYPQLHCLTQAHAHSMSAWEFPNYIPKLNFELNKTSKLTDVLSNASISANGFLINDKVKKIFENFNLMSHQYYEANIIIPKSGEVQNYFWLHLCQTELAKQLDYKRTVFYETEWTFRKEIIDIESYEHYERLKEQDHEAKFGIELDEIFLSNMFNKNLDMFTFLPFSENIYISNRLKEALENDHVTGFNFDETTEIKV